MLELIVLGTLPGHEFRITFMQVLLISLAFLAVSLFMYEFKLGKKLTNFSDMVRTSTPENPEQ